MRNLLWPLAGVLTLSFAAAHGALAQEQPFPDANCAITPPEGWERSTTLPASTPGLFAAFNSADKTRFLILLATNRGKPNEAMNEHSIVQFDQGVVSAGGGQRTSGKFVEIAGFHAYERLGTLDVKGKHLSTLADAVPTGDGIYLLECIRSDGEAQDAPEIRQALASFRFLHPPGPPAAPQSAAFRLGKIVGYVGAFLGMLTLVIFGIVKAVTSGRPRRAAGYYPTMPPPFYPNPAASPPPSPSTPNRPPPLPPPSPSGPPA